MNIRIDVSGDCDGGHIAAYLQIERDPEGEYCYWEEVEAIFQDVLSAKSLEEAQNYVKAYVENDDE